MWLLIAFIVIWAISPGPVLVMTLHEARKHGVLAGVAVAGGATATSTFMVIAAMMLHAAGVSTLLSLDDMQLIQRIGALGIIGMGLSRSWRRVFRSAPAAQISAWASSLKWEPPVCLSGLA